MQCFEPREQGLEGKFLASANVDEAWMDRTGAIGRDEEEMLSYLDNRRPTSRLTCQIRLTDGLDGVVVHVP